MPMVIIGVLLGAAWLAGIAPISELDWWWLLLPFGAAVAWWAFADSTGVTQRRAMQKMEDRKVERRQRAMVHLGLDAKRKGQADNTRVDAQRRAKTLSGSTPKRPTEPSDPRL